MNFHDLSIYSFIVLGVDAINKANSGHPGMVLGAAPIIYTLFSQIMNASLILPLPIVVLAIINVGL